MFRGFSLVHACDQRIYYSVLLFCKFSLFRRSYGLGNLVFSFHHLIFYKKTNFFNAQ